MKTYSSYEVKHGVVVGFEPFQKLPTVLIAYLTTDFTGGDVKILAWNSETEDTEVVAATDDILFDKDEGMRALDRAIDKAEADLASAQERKVYFLKHFRAYWSETEAVTETS